MKKREKTKFFQKHELFKIVGIFMIVAALLTWVMEIGLYQGGQFINDEMMRIGLSDFLAFSMYGIYYFTTHFIILIVAAGFYKFLGSIPAYQKLTDNIAKKFSNVPALFAIIVMILLAAFAGVVTDYFVAIALIPFFVTILSKLKVDKTVGVASTFGGVLIGILASSYSGRIVGELSKAPAQYGLGIKYGYQKYPIMILFGISLLLLAYFIWRKCSKETAEEKILKDPFTSSALAEMDKKSLKRVKTAPIAIMLFVILGSIVLGVIPWKDCFEVTLFSEVYESITTATLFDTPIFQYVLGNTMLEFGSWDLLTVSVVMLIGAMLIKIIYSVSFDDLIDEFSEGVKRIVPTLGMVLMIFGITLFSGAYPTIANLINGILKEGTDVLYVLACGIVNGLFTPDFNYMLRYTSTAYTSLQNIDNVALALQSGFGFISMIAPSSLVLITGLSMLDVKYSEWFKFIWKFILLVLILVVAVLVVL